MRALLALVALAFVGCCYAETECGILQRLLVKKQWVELSRHGDEYFTMNRGVWKRFFHDKPESLTHFERVNGNDVYSAKFGAHVARVYAGMDMVISMLDEEDMFNQALAHLNKQHKERGIPAEYFTLFSQTYLDVAGDELGHCFDQAAWRACFKVINDGITG